MTSCSRSMDERSGCGARAGRSSRGSSPARCPHRRRSRSIRRSRASPASTRRPPWRHRALRPRRSRRPTDAGSTSATSAPVTGPWGAARSLTSRPPRRSHRPSARRRRARGGRRRDARPHRPPWERADRGGRVGVCGSRFWHGRATTSPRGPGNAGRWTCRAAGRSVRAGTWTSRSRTASPLATATRCRSRSTSRCATDDEWRRVGVVRVPVIEPPEASRSVD